MRRPNNPSNNQEILMKSLIHISAGLFLSATLAASASANDHKILGVVAMPRNETNDRGDVQLSGATVYFKVSNSASQSLSVPSTIKEGETTGWININSDNDNKRCVKKIAFSGHTINSSDMASLKIIGDD